MASSSESSRETASVDQTASIRFLDEKRVGERRRQDTIQTVSDEENEERPPFKGGIPLGLHKRRTHTIGILKLRPQDDTDPTDWWFASTAIPLIAATFAPMANMLSIAALVVYWRNTVNTPDDPSTYYSASTGYEDPRWCTALNAASLACGFVGNLFLLLNFTKRVRYIIALPVTIVLFYIASAILIAIIICINKYAPPRQDEVYSQGFWHAIIAACLYMFNSMILMANMWGYFLGHYPQNFTLNDEHRNLIMQTMLFFLWLAGGAGVFYRTEDWQYPDALYFCDVTILTIGFGDYYATDDLGRGLVFPYSVGGTIILGLMVSSIHKFARELSTEKVVRKHVETRRVNTLSRAITIEDLDDHSLKRLATGQKMSISRPSERDAEHIQAELNELARQERIKRRTINFQDPDKADYSDGDAEEEPAPRQFIARNLSGGRLHKTIRTLTFPITKPVTMSAHSLHQVMSRKQKQILMLEERDRFNAMRSVQTNASTFKRYYALAVSVLCFGMLWCLGAVVFYYAERTTQALNYFECLYFCYVSLLTIGYGDLSPRSNSGKAFFVLWSLIAVPTMTILVSDLGDTVIGGFKRGVLKNDLGLTSQQNVKNSPSSWRSILARFIGKRNTETGEGNSMHGKSGSYIESARRRSSIVVLDEHDRPIVHPKTIEELASEDVSDAEMMRRLAFAIRQTADDLKHQPDKKYSYEEWVQFSRLIKFSKFDKEKIRSGQNAINQLEQEETEDGIVEWDWLDTNSPMASLQSESEWVLDRLCESLLRVFKKSDLVLGGLTTGEVIRQPGKPDDAQSPNINRPFNEYSFAPKEDKLTEASPPTTAPDPGSQSPDMMSKMTKFFQGEYDGTSQWSKRAKAKLAQSQATENNEARVSQDRRRSSTALANVHRRHGPFSQDP